MIALKHLPKKAVPVSYISPLSSSSSSFAQFSTATQKKKVVVVGGVAGGATAAARLSRLSNNFDITIIEKSPDVSFANCGLPYYIGREIVDRSKLSLQTPQSLSNQLGVKVFTNTEVTTVARDAKTVAMKDLVTGESTNLSYDYLILSPGASALKPRLPGIDHPRVMTLRNLQDMDKMDVIIKNEDVKSVVVVGAGFIGLEMAEQLRHVGKTVHLVQKTSAVLPQADPEMAEFLHAPLVQHGIKLHLGDGLAGFVSKSDTAVEVKLESGKSIDADLVVLSIGVRPESKLAVDAKLNVSRSGHIQVNEYMQTNDPNIYAVGDVIETKDLVFPDRKTNVALGNIANMQARIAADHMGLGKSVPYKGSLGTSIVRAFDTILAIAGWNETRLKDAGIPYATTTITAWAHASYYPGAMPITMKITYDPITGRVYGGQAVGVDGVDKRIDVIATAITAGMTIDDLSLLQLTYSPPFGSARDVVNVAGLAARNQKDNLVHASFHLTEDDTAAKASTPREVKVLDVRAKDIAQANPVPNSINIPYKDLNNMDLNKVLDKNVEYKTLCLWGKTAYFSSRVLENQGFKTSTLIGGAILHQKPKIEQN